VACCNAIKRWPQHVWLLLHGLLLMRLMLLFLLQSWWLLRVLL
jgi:hypothetical protein